MDLKTQLKEKLIEGLNLEDVRAEDIKDDEPLFGEGLGLDSLDAVELVVIVQKNFGVEITDMEQGRDAFASINALADFIEKNRNS
ncbi:MAG: phosphopantetheine-binding protein [Desulfonatronovibrionaceae bacterium]